MIMKAKICILVFLCNGLLLSSDIHELSKTSAFSRAPEINAVYEVYDSLLALSNKLYRSNKIALIRDEGPVFASETWPPGTWGRGYYTKDIEYYPKEYFTEKYAQWINNERACNPLIREIGRRIMGYIHEYRSSSHSSLSQIKSAIQYLVDNQTANGGYIWWFKRTGKYEIQGEPNTTGNLYTTSIALRALCEGYEFLNSSLINDPEINMALIAAIRKSADYIVSYPDLDVNYPNGKLLAVWGLTGAFKITGDNTYFNKSVSLVFGSELKQREDGSFITPDRRESYHDANIFYHGMNLRGLAELYSVLKDNDQRRQLREMIVKSINHIIDYNGGDETRLNDSWDGAYNSEHARFEKGSAVRGMILLGGLILTRRYVDFETGDKVSLDHLINYTINGMVYIGRKSAYYKYADADIAIHNIGMYLEFAGYTSR